MLLPENESFQFMNYEENLILTMNSNLGVYIYIQVSFQEHNVSNHLVEQVLQYAYFQQNHKPQYNIFSSLFARLSPTVPSQSCLERYCGVMLQKYFFVSFCKQGHFSFRLTSHFPAYTNEIFISVTKNKTFLHKLGKPF